MWQVFEIHLTHVYAYTLFKRSARLTYLLTNMPIPDNLANSLVKYIAQSYSDTSITITL